MTNLDQNSLRHYGQDEVVAQAKQAQLALEQQTDLVRSHAALLNLTHDSIMVFHLDGCLTFWNQGAEQTYGWCREEALGKDVHHLLQTQGEQSLEEIQNHLLTHHRWEGELLHTRRDGSQIVVHSRQVLRLDANNQPLEILEINNDISDRKRVEAELQNAHAQLERRVQQRTQELAQANAQLQAEIRDRQNTEIALRQSEEALARRERFLTTLVDIQSRLLTHTSPDAIYQQVLEPLGRMAGADRAYLFENGQNGVGQLGATRRYGWCSPMYAHVSGNPTLQYFEYSTFWPEWQILLAQGDIVNCTVAEFTPTVQKLLEPQGVLAILILPLFVQQKFWGFVGFDNCHAARRWDALEINLLGAAVSSLAMTLEHWFAEQQLQHRADCDRLLAAIALRIRESLDLNEILQRTAAEVRQFLHADRVLIYRFDGEHGLLVAASVLPAWDIYSSASEQHHIWYRTADAVYEQGEIAVVNDIEQHGSPLDYLTIMRQLQVRAKMVVPIVQSHALPDQSRPGLTLDFDQPVSSNGLQDGRSLWGVLAVHQCSAVRQWRAFEIDLVQKLSVQVAIAIQQAQLFSQLQQQAEREHLLNQLSQALNSSLDPEHILQAIVNQAGQGFGVDRVVIFMVDEQIRALNEWLANPTVPSMLGFQCAMAEWPDLLDPDSDFNQGRAFYCLDLNLEATTAARKRLVAEMQVRSVLSVPIVIRDRIFGALTIFTTTCYRTFTQDEIQLLHRIAAHAAIALYNAQSYIYLEQLVKQRTQELEAEKLVSEMANRAKSEFLATMSHELRTPLNAILGLSQILQQEIFGEMTPKQLEYTRHIHSSGEHLLMLINDILDLAKVESGRETIHLSQLAIAEICHYCLTLVWQQAHEQGLQLISQIDPAIEHCYADERRLKQMLLNLLSNAVKFTPSGSVTLQVEPRAQGIVFIVQDTGIGIPADKLPLLFQPFSQVDSQLNRRYNGTGLGLALTRKLAHLHGGDVTVTSVPQQGSTFTLYLPILACEDPTIPQLEPHLQAAPVMVPHHKGRILIVEDDGVSAMLLQDYLKSIGYQVLLQSEVNDFLLMVQDYQPDLILMDVQLSDTVTGLDLLQLLRAQPEFQSLPVVIVSAMAMAGDRESFLQAGASAYLSKPLNIVQLESILLDYLD